VLLLCVNLSGNEFETITLESGDNSSAIFGEQ